MPRTIRTPEDNTDRSGAWLLLVISLAGQNQTARMRIWRSLKSAGAGALRDGAYLLPASDTSQELMTQVADEVTRADGTAHVITVNSTDEAQEHQFRQLFNRDTDYAVVHAALDALLADLLTLTETDCRRRFATLEREMAAIAAVDFFPTATRRQLATAFEDARTLITTHFSPDEPRPGTGVIPRRDRADFPGTPVGHACPLVGRPHRLCVADPPVHRSEGHLSLARIDQGLSAQGRRV
ncbi:hypothetical protein PEC18_35795 [Paucibacter sp. O1-1]|nr:hypothetical protein [Paucibacter sp. O1-1]MDA3831022.1 hypothetical protein [Paucibacter sp. O1-1]